MALHLSFPANGDTGRKIRAQSHPQLQRAQASLGYNRPSLKMSQKQTKNTNKKFKCKLNLAYWYNYNLQKTQGTEEHTTWNQRGTLIIIQAAKFQRPGLAVNVLNASTRRQADLHEFQDTQRYISGTLSQNKILKRKKKKIHKTNHSNPVTPAFRRWMQQDQKFKARPGCYHAEPNEKSPWAGPTLLNWRNSGQGVIKEVNGSRHVQGILNPFVSLVIDESVEMATRRQQNKTGMVAIRGTESSC